MKEKIIKGIEHLVFSNLLVSLSTGMLCLGICSKFQIPNKFWYAFFVFSSTLFTYNFQRLIKSNHVFINPTNHISWVLSHKRELRVIIILSLILSGISFLQVYKWNLISLLILLFSLAISFFYVFRFGNLNLREIPHLKIHLIAIIWIVAVGIFPLLNEQNFIVKNWLFVLAHYFYIVSVTIPFDIRDLKYDHPNQKTIPQFFGVKRAKIISVISLLIYFCIVVSIFSLLLQNIFYISIFLITLLLLIKTKESRNEFYFSGLIEASIFVVGLSLM